MYAKANGISSVSDYSAPTFEKIKANPKMNGIHSEQKVEHLRYIADALLEAQEKYNVKFSTLYPNWDKESDIL